MPHKHKRKRDDDKSTYDLPPTTRAKPLPVRKPESIFTSEKSNKRRKPNKNKAQQADYNDDDTPKDFARLMAFQTTGKRVSGLDDGTKTQAKKRKGKEATTEGAAAAAPTQHSAPPPLSTLQIKPGERLSDFALRVDQSLPLSLITKQTNRNLPADLKERAKLTKHNKRLARMQADWRKTESKLKDREADEEDDLEDQKEEDNLLWSGIGSGKRKKGKLKDVGDEDPWKELEKKRKDTKQKSLQDVVVAPPVLGKVKNIFKIKGEGVVA